ncbi:Transcription factor GTE8 [Vitis vinifera]|uniref:Transcription factor GTE8 n=1 Tax=Vitis vinifera TaxID=29760 RepID=A0A438BT48_VITVI|nr:Transcription factor GTE8 [Vitis vinifera]
MAKNDRFPGGYYRAFENQGESEGSGSSGRVDMEIAASEDSCVPMRKCINLNSNNCDSFSVPIQVLPLSNISPSERKDLVLRLRMELEQIRLLQKKVDLQRTNGVALSSSSDILSCSNGQRGHVDNARKSSALTSGPGKKLEPLGNKNRAWNRGTSGRFESATQASAPSTASVLLMKQCETLLKQLMSHQHGWVFNEPVDIVKLNIPDYFTIIKHPMDLGTIKGKIASGAYSSPLDFAADVRLTFSNAQTFNPPGNDVHKMADTLSKFFEVRWKTIEKKLPVTKTQSLPGKYSTHGEMKTAKPMPPSKRGRDLEDLLGEIPVQIIDFLRVHSSNGRETGEDDEIEVDIEALSDDTLFTLRKLLDDYLQEKQKSHGKAEPCEIELLHDSGPSNSSIQPCKGNDPVEEDIDIVGNEAPVSSYPPVEIEKDTEHRSSKCVLSRSFSEPDNSSSESELDGAKTSKPVNISEGQESLDSGALLDEKTSAGNPCEENQSVSGMDQLEQTSQQKPNYVESDSQQDGIPEKLYRAAVLKNRFADTIFKAREKTLNQIRARRGILKKLRREREELEMQRRKGGLRLPLWEKARLQAEAKAAEDARRRAEAEAAAEAKKKRELERAAARQALQKMEKTVEINENSRFLEDLELLRAAPAEHLPSSVDETSPDHSQDGLSGFRFVGSNPLEQLGLYMKVDDEEEDGEPHSPPDVVNDVEEGEID